MEHGQGPGSTHLATGSRATSLWFTSMPRRRNSTLTRRWGQTARNAQCTQTTHADTQSYSSRSRRVVWTARVSASRNLFLGLAGSLDWVVGADKELSPVRESEISSAGPV